MMRVSEKEKALGNEIGLRALEHSPSDFLLGPGVIGEADEPVDLRTYWQAIVKRRWTILSILFVTFTLVLIWTLKQRRIYRSEVLIEIGKSREGASVKDLLESSGEESPTELETQIQILQSKTLAQRVISELRLDRSPEINSSAGVANQSVSQPVLWDTMLKSFVGSLQVRPIKGSRLVYASFDSGDPELAARVANALAKNYILQNMEAHWQATQMASEWLAEKLSETRISLEKAEENLQEYARANGLFFMVSRPDEPEALISERLHRLQDDLGKAETERFKEEWLARLAETGSYTNVPGIFENATTQNIETRLTDLRSKRSELLAVFTPDYPRVKLLDFQIGELERMLEGERKRVAEGTVETYNAIRTRENLLRDAFGRQQAEAGSIAERSVHYNILKRDVDTNRELYNGLLQRLKEMGVAASMRASTIRVVDAAQPARFPVKPRVTLNLILGIVAGLVLGLAAALAQEALDITLKTAEDVERILHLPPLALIPAVGSVDGRQGRVLDVDRIAPSVTRGIEEPTEKGLPGGEGIPKPWYRIDDRDVQQSALLEAFRSLRTSVLLSTADRPPRSVLICSAQPSEGKTTVAINLAISMAQLGTRVLMLEGDIRRPSVHRALGLAARSGVVNYLTGQADWKKLIQPTGVNNLDALVSGPVPPNPTELLCSERMRTLVCQAVAEYGFVVIDSPPMLSVADSRILMPLVDGVILVVASGITPRQLVRRAKVQAHEVGSNMVGVVLNKVDYRMHSYYGYYSSHDEYASAEEGSERT